MGKVEGRACWREIYLTVVTGNLKNKALDYLKHEEVKRSAFEVMADWQQQELSIRMSALEACNPDEIFSEEVEKSSVLL